MSLLHCKLVFSIAAVFPHVLPKIHDNKTLSRELLKTQHSWEKNQTDEFSVKRSSHQLLHERPMGLLHTCAKKPWTCIHSHCNSKAWAAYFNRQECGFGRCVTAPLADTQQCNSEAASPVNPLLSASTHWGIRNPSISHVYTQKSVWPLRI